MYTKALDQQTFFVLRDYTLNLDGGPGSRVVLTGQAARLWKKIYLSTYLLTYLPTYLSIYLSTYLSTYLPIYLSIHTDTHACMHIYQLCSLIEPHKLCRKTEPDLCCHTQHMRSLRSQ